MAYLEEPHGEERSSKGASRERGRTWGNIRLWTC